jgi:hypothetical protein
MLGSLTDLGSNSDTSFGEILSSLQAGHDNSRSALTANSSGGVGTATGLGNSQSVYAMMTRIDGLNLAYKSQYSELSQMDSCLPRLEGAANQLGMTTLAEASDSIVARLQDFAQQYNAWIQRFKPDVQRGAVLANTQAAEVPLYELDQVVENRFIGAKDGFHGMADLGVSIDPASGLMSVDAGQLGAALKDNKQAVVDAVREFSAKFAAAANLLASDDNLIQHRLNNLSGAIGYIGANLGSWQQEFGRGGA